MKNRTHPAMGRVKTSCAERIGLDQFGDGGAALRSHVLVTENKRASARTVSRIALRQD